jgi:hypothetical protein
MWHLEGLGCIRAAIRRVKMEILAKLFELGNDNLVFLAEVT